MAQKERLIQRTKEYLDSQGWRYNALGNDGDAFEMHMNIKCKLKSCRVIILVSESEIQSLAVSPISADENARANVVEFITRANYGLKIGKFEFDYRDGEVRYQSCLPCREGLPSLRDVERVVDMPIMMLQRYGDGLAKNLMGFGNPAADIREIEGDH